MYDILAPTHVTIHVCIRSKHIHVTTSNTSQTLVQKEMNAEGNSKIETCEVECLRKEIQPSIAYIEIMKLRG